MTPEAVRIVSELREQFYSRFEEAMKTPVTLSNRNSSTNHAIATWLDQHQQLNYLCVYAHTAPDNLVPKRPFILRASINRGAIPVPAVKPKKGAPGMNQTWQFNLTALPEELLDFVPWTVSLIQSSKGNPVLAAQEPPSLLTFKLSNGQLLNDAWTRNAWQCLEELSFPPKLLERC